MLRKLVAFSAAVELAIGLVLMVDPSLVVRLLLGAEVAGLAVLLARCFGVALVALGIASWPGAVPVATRGHAIPALLLYNAIIALYLAYIGVGGEFRGSLLWPAVGLHAIVAMLMGWQLQRGTGDRVDGS